ncbi:hypothetical protein PoB_007071300 [Plakobranchus ocellatus]|uniref:Uncharacterized protein n=1 Tax=Plakobranchus ocellatus TaxID=259542 RepID=A0AAV4DIV8_9GAST|nr:hypothetical protein PoB_007071300 [Plakobranchus ocellatus]
MALLERNPELSPRQSEAMTMARSIVFNRHNVATFFRNFEEVYRKVEVTPFKFTSWMRQVSPPSNPPNMFCAERTKAGGARYFNPLKPFTICEICKMMHSAWIRTEILVNIMSGLKPAEFGHLISLFLSGDVFMPSDVIDRPLPAPPQLSAAASATSTSAAPQSWANTSEASQSSASTSEASQSSASTSATPTSAPPQC